MIIPLKADGTFKQPDCSFEGVPIYYDPVFDVPDDEGYSRVLAISDPEVTDLQRYPLGAGEKLMDRIMWRMMSHPQFYASVRTKAV